MNNSSSIYQRITDIICEKLKQGEIPWEKPFTAPGIFPMNLVSMKQYQGINQIVLQSCGFSSPFFLTFNQIKQLGGSVKPGAKSLPVVFWKFLNVGKQTTASDETEEKDQFGRIPFLKYFNVFNLEQTEGIPANKIPSFEPKIHNPIPEAEAMANSYLARGPKLITGQSGASYSSASDCVKMPDKETFTNEFFYYSVLFHEMGHSTGHITRLNRKLGNRFGSEDYSVEELIAEFTASFLCGQCGFEKKTIENNAAYIQNWLGALSKNPKWLVMAAGKAQKAADLILGNTREDNVPDEEKEAA